MDGVFAMQPFYARGGFQFSHRNLRMQGVGVAARGDAGLEALSELPFEWVEALDRHCFGFARPSFLEAWIAPRHGLAVGRVKGDRLLGMGVIRRCLSGYKVGPLFAMDSETAELIFRSLSAHASNEPLFLDVPECNLEGMALAARHGMTEVFGCARMYHGPAPALPWQKIYGVTTFELG
jgi:hypothetical protein